MGFQDRDYERYGSQGGGFFSSGGGGGGQRMIVTNIVIVCVIIFFIDAFTQQPKVVEVEDPNTGEVQRYQYQEGRVSDFMALDGDMLTHPWKIWQLLTYGFAHASLGSPTGWRHIAFNMFTLWMLGRMVEMKYGRKEFLTFYLAAIVFAGIAWVLVRVALGQTGASCVGASGGVTAVVMLFVLCFPHEKLLIWGIFPVPAWVIGVLVIGYDMLSAFSSSTGVAHDAHLAGVLFAFIYWKFGWHLSSKLPENLSVDALKPTGKSGLKIHSPEDDIDRRDRMADEVLDKLHREGEESLSRKERKILEEYSRRMKQKRG